MAQKNTTSRKQSRSSYITLIISISLVLFLIGLLGLLVLNANKISKSVKENIGVAVIIKNNVKEVDIRRLQKTLDASKYVKSTRFVDKKTAADNFEKELGQEFTKFLGYNPLQTTIEVKLYADYANTDSIAKIEAKLMKLPQVYEVDYQKSLVHLVNDNVKKIGFIILIFSILLFAVSFTLINNTIRLSIYSQRFIINTMQLVGATRSFIRRPFVRRSLLYGFLGALFANILLSGVIYWTQKQFGQVVALSNYEMIGILFLLVILIGLWITWISTLFAVNKYLRIDSDKLY